jgi:D-serine deaminase-like pyridoxal phosphate-dependent protein
MLYTPCLLLDTAKTKANIAHINALANKHDITLRPHLKTCKSVPVAKLAMAAEWKTAAVSTLVECELFFNAGIQDIRYTPPFAANKLRLVAPLIKQGLNFGVMLDHALSAELLEQEAKALGINVAITIEIDCDQNRGGVVPFSDDFWAIVAVVRVSEHLHFAGIYSYAGNTYSMQHLQDRAALVEHHRSTLVEVKQALIEKGMQGFEVGMGSTPALNSARSLTGLTEVCCGVYMFQDLAQVGVGSANISDIAISVLATVVQQKQDNGRIYIDAGGIALSQDRSTASQNTDYGYGLVCDEAGEPLLNGTVIVQKVSQEHGLVMRMDGTPVPAEVLKVGERVRVLPNHVCMMVSHYDEYYLVNGRPEKDALTWSRSNGWQIQANSH